MEVAADICWFVVLAGTAIVAAAAISRTIQRLLRLSDETVNDPWFRRTDTSELSLASTGCDQA